MLSFIQTIGFRLWLISSVIVVVPLTIHTAFTEYDLRTSALTLAKNNLRQDTLFKTELIRESLPLNQSAVNFIIQALNLETEFPKTIDPDLGRKLKEFFSDGFREITLVLPISSTEKIVVASGITANEGANYNSRLAITPDIPILISIAPSEDNPHRFLIVTEANIYHPETKTLIGILYATHDAESILDPILTHSSYVGTLLFFTNTELAIASSYITDNDISIIKKKLIGISREKNNFFKENINKKTFLCFEDEVPELHLIVISYQNYSNIFSKCKKIFFSNLTCLLLIIPSLLLGYFLTKRLSNPLLRLSFTMIQAGKGSSQNIYKPSRYGFEINHLGYIFNKMLKTFLAKQIITETAQKEKNEALLELDLGKKAQETLLTSSFLPIPELEISKIYIPALSVGGDFYDLFTDLREENLFIVVADAADKGVSACCYSLELKIMLQTLLQETSSLETTVIEAAKLFHSDTTESGMFVTASLNKYNRKTGILSYYSCGHVPAILLKKTGSPVLLKHMGTALGFLPDIQIIACNEIILEDEDKLVFYSDGITEAHNKQYELFGEERLLKTIECTRNMNSEETSAYIMNEIKTFVQGQQQHDDITLLVIKLKDQYE
ncbi:MAG: PP2C family protein-serine/threonine phosphatase [Victivallaceae bacterium]